MNVRPVKTLVLGGVKSGKSRFAEQLANKRSDQVTFIATAEALDEEMAARIQRHKQDRPKHWTVLEAPVHLAETLKGLHGETVVVIDCLTLWLTNLLMQENDELLQQEIACFKSAVEKFPGALVLVSNETNMGIMPLGDLTRRYCDLAGRLHQDLAALCDRVELIVAGLPMTLKQEVVVDPSSNGQSKNGQSNHE